MLIATERLDLHRLSPAQFAALAAGDGARAGALGGFTVTHALSEWDRAHAGTRARELRAHPERASWISRAIVERASRTMVGRVGFHDRPDAAGTVEIGYAVFAPYRRRGYATEAAGALIEWAAGQGVARVLASVAPANDASLRVVARLGFVRIDERIDDRDGLEYVFVRELAP